MALNVAKLIAEAKARAAANKLAELAEEEKKALTPAVQKTETEKAVENMHGWIPRVGNFQYNTEQRAAINMAMQQKNFVLTGAAGTGKTTVVREIVAQMATMPHVQPIQNETKWLHRGDPGIVIWSFTNKAVENLRMQLPDDLRSHCMTGHKLIEFGPVFYEEIDPITKKLVNKMRFEPKFNALNKLPHISVMIIEESSMVQVDLFRMILEALPFPSRTQFIFLGDINQLQPVFGFPILGFKLATEPIIELTEVYRQALESPIITLAHQVKNGVGIPKIAETRVDDRGDNGKVTFHVWKKRITKENALKVFEANFVRKLCSDSEFYDPMQDMILCPYNVSFGTEEINRMIAQCYGEARGALVHEVVTGFEKLYLAIGDKVFAGKREAIITNIHPNPAYGGTPFVQPSTKLDRWGRIEGKAAKFDLSLESLDDIDLDSDEFLVAHGLGGRPEEGAKRQASHKVVVRFLDDDTETVLQGSGELSKNNFLFGYCLTVHKSQGSEWRKVILALHNSHSPMISRELIYTAVTRARKELYIIMERDEQGKPNSITKGAFSPEVKGTKLEHKIQYFRQKILENVKKAQDSGDHTMDAFMGLTV